MLLRYCLHIFRACFVGANLQYNLYKIQGSKEIIPFRCRIFLYGILSPKYLNSIALSKVSVRLLLGCMGAQAIVLSTILAFLLFHSQQQQANKTTQKHRLTLNIIG